MKRSNTRVLIVEDETVISMDIMYMLQSCGYSVDCCVRTGEQAIEKVSICKPHIVLMDIKLAGEIDGIEAVEKIHEISDVPVIYITSNSDITTIKKAMATQPLGVLIKPITDAQLCRTIQTKLTLF